MIRAISSWVEEEFYIIELFVVGKFIWISIVFKSENFWKTNHFMFECLYLQRKDNLYSFWSIISSHIDFINEDKYKTTKRKKLLCNNMIDFMNTNEWNFLDRIRKVESTQDCTQAVFCQHILSLIWTNKYIITLSLYSHYFCIITFFSYFTMIL